MTTNNPALDRVYDLLQQAHVFLNDVPAAAELQAEIHQVLRNATKSKQARAVASDAKGRTWHVLERADKSVCVFYVLPFNSAHWIVWDEIDQTKEGNQDGNIQSEETTEDGTEAKG